MVQWGLPWHLPWHRPIDWQQWLNAKVLSKVVLKKKTGCVTVVHSGKQLW